MQGHFMDMKSAYVFGLLQALQNYDPKKGASFNTFQAYYTKEAIDDYIRTMRTGYTRPKQRQICTATEGNGALCKIRLQER